MVSLITLCQCWAKADTRCLLFTYSKHPVCPHCMTYMSWECHLNWTLPNMSCGTTVFDTFFIVAAMKVQRAVCERGFCSICFCICSIFVRVYRALSYLIDEKKLLLWRKLYSSSNIILYSLSRYVLSRFMAVASQIWCTVCDALG